MVYKEQVSRENLLIDSAATTTRSVALTGTGFPGSTELLVALVNISTSTAIATPAGWTASGVGGANGNNQMRVFLKQGDGATNSITIDSASAIATVGIFVAAGYAGLTPIIAGGANGGTGTNFPFSGISGQPGNGLTILGIGLATAPSSWSAWSASTPILASQPSNARGWWGVSDYIDGTGSPNSTVTWNGSRSQRYIAVVMPLQVVSTSPTAGADLSGSGALSVAAQPQTSAAAVFGGSGQLAASAQGQGAALAAMGGSGQLAPSATPSVPQGAALAGSGELAGTVTPVGGSSVPTQAEMPAAPFDFYPAPTYAWGAGAAPSGAGYIAVSPTNPLIRLTGPAGKGTVAGSVSGFVNPSPLQDISGAGTGTNPLVFPPYGIRLTTDYRELYIRLAQRSYAGFSNVSARAASRLKVNGKWTSITPVYLGANLGMPANPDNLTAGEYWLKLIFPTTEMRELEFTTHLEFGGVVAVDGTGANSQAPTAPKHRIVMLDGSLTGAEKHQTGNFALTGGSAGTYTAVSSHLWYAAQILAYDDVINAATGSSGYAISGDTVSIKSTSKIPRDAVDHNPATVIVGGPNNDIGAGRTVAQVSADLDIILPSVNGSLPNALRIVEGGFTAPAMGSQASAEATLTPYNDAIRAKAQQYGWWFVNPTTGQTYNPQGVVVKTTSNWVYQDTSSISSDNTHPTQDGARKLGIMLADAIMPAHASSAIEASAPLAGAGSLSAGIAPSNASPATLSGAGSLGAAVTPSAARAAALAGSGTLAVTAAPATSRSSALTADGALAASVALTVARTAFLGGDGTLGASRAPLIFATALLGGTGTLGTDASGGSAASAAFTGSGSLSAGIARPSTVAIAPLAGTGALGSTAEGAGAASPSLAGAGQLGTVARAAFASAAAFAGAGVLSAVGVTGNAQAASLAGAGQLAAGVAFRVLVDGLLSGSGALGSTRRPSAAVVVELSGGGALVATVEGTTVILGSHTFVIRPWADGAGHDVDAHKRRAYAEVTGYPLTRGRVNGMIGPDVEAVTADDTAYVTYTLTR